VPQRDGVARGKDKKPTVSDAELKGKRPGAVVTPTLRAIVDVIAGSVHRTGGNIADRTGLPLGFLTGVLVTLEKAGIVECVDHREPQPFQRPRHASENWTWELKHPRDRIVAMLEKNGYDPDASLTPDV
jgi:DNA-binding transcriptional ArsR family regulator